MFEGVIRDKLAKIFDLSLVGSLTLCRVIRLVTLDIVKGISARKNMIKVVF